MRTGMPTGTTSGTSSTQLWMPMRGDSTAQAMRDRSGWARTVTFAGTGALDIADEYYGIGLSFPGTARLECSGFAPDSGYSTGWCLSGRFHSLTPTVEHAAVTCRAANGSFNSICALDVGGDSVTFTAYDDAGVAYVVTSGTLRPVTGMPGAHTTWTVARTIDVRVDVVPGGYLYLTINGVLVGLAPAPPMVAVGPFSALQIGGESSGTRTDYFTGTIADVQIQAKGTGWYDSPSQRDMLAVNLPTFPLSRRQLHYEHVDLPINAKDAAWVADGTAPTLLSLPFADLALGGLILHPDDVRAVTSTTSSTSTTLTPLGNRVELLAATSSFMVDMVNSLVLLSPDITDPSTCDTFAIVIRAGWSTAPGMESGPRYYPPALISEEGGERRHSYFDQAYPTGGGAPSVLDAQHPDLPADFASEEATDTLWSGSATERFLLSDAMPLSEGVALFAGLCDGPPEVTPDTLTLRRLHETARIYRVPISRTKADLRTWPHMVFQDSGYVWPTIVGPGHKGVRAICVDRRMTSANGYKTKWKVCDHQIAAMQYEYSGGIDFELQDVDLRVGEFRLFQWPANSSVFVSVDGYGVPSPPTVTGPTAAAGIPGQCHMTPTQQGTDLLAFAGISSTSFGSTWTDMATRVQAMRRWLLPLDSNRALVTRWHTFLAESLLHHWYVPATRKHELRDVVKADAIQHVIRDEDVIAETWIHDKDRLASYASAQAWAYIFDPLSYVSKLGEATSIQLKVDPRYAIKDTWSPIDGALVGFLTSGQLELWFAVIRRFLEEVSYFYKVTVGNRYADIEQMAVVDVQVTTRPVAAENRFRALSVKPIAGGKLELELFSEALYPADGTSLPTTREAGDPFTRWLFVGATYSGSDIVPTPLADTAGSWAPVEDTQGKKSLEMVQGYWPYPTDVDHRFQVFAQRIGGAANANLQFRLVRCQEDGTYISTIAEIAGVSTSGSFPTADTTLTVPTVDTLVRLEYKTAVGVTGKLWCASWEGGDRNTNTITSDRPPTLCHLDGVADGIACDEVDTITAVSGLRPFVSTTTHMSPGEGRVLVYVDPGSYTDMVLYAYERNPLVTAPGPDPGVVLDSVEIDSGAGFYELDFVRGTEPSIYALYYQHGAGAGALVYAWSVDWRDAR